MGHKSECVPVFIFSTLIFQFNVKYLNILKVCLRGLRCRIVHRSPASEVFGSTRGQKKKIFFFKFVFSLTYLPVVVFPLHQPQSLLSYEKQAHAVHLWIFFASPGNLALISLRFT